MPGRKKANRRVTVAAIAAEGRPITKADLRHKLRELGGYVDVGGDEPLVDAVVEAAVIAEAEEIAEQALGPVGILLSHAPKTQLAVAVGVAAVLVAYRVGGLLGRRRGPQVEVWPITARPGT